MGELFVVGFTEVEPTNDNVALIGRVKSADDICERRFTGA